MGVLYPVLNLRTVSICLGVGYLELLILVKAMREPSSGIGE